MRDAPHFESTLRNKVVVCAHLGRVKEVNSEIARLLKFDPALTISRLKASTSYYPPGYLEGLRKAGLPEG